MELKTFQTKIYLTSIALSHEFFGSLSIISKNASMSLGIWLNRRVNTHSLISFAFKKANLIILVNDKTF